MEDDEVPNLLLFPRCPQLRRGMCQNPGVPNRFKSAKELSWQADW